MNSIMKRSIAMAVGAALFALSASVAAGEKLSDADLDQITAGSGAISQVVIFNPGKGPGELKVNPNRTHATCININCINVSEPPRTSGIVAVMLPSGEIKMHFIRQSPF